MIVVTLALIAQATAGTPPTAPETEKKICRQVTPTGSVRPHIECHTKAEWVSIARRDRKNVDDIASERGNNVPSGERN